MRRTRKIKGQACTPNKTGSAMLETTAGLFILLPVFLLLLDIISLVIAQSINDDLAKQAARFAAQSADSASATNAATDFLSHTSYSSATSGLVILDTQQTQVNFNTTTGQVQVTTQIQCNLPIPVPFGGPSSTTFKAQATWPIVGPYTPTSSAGG